MTPSEAIDDYLKAIFEIASENGRASTAVLAKRLGVAPASVTGMLRKLSEETSPWIDYAKHHGANLTDRGRRRALEVIRHHRLIELFLHTQLGYSWDEVHAEAEKLEHAISEIFEERIAAQLGDPEIDPHGHPIPRKDGSVPIRREISLLEMDVGAEATIARVSDADPKVLKYLSGLGILPGIRIELIERGPFDGPLMLRVEGADEVRVLGVRVGREIHVVPDVDPQPARQAVGSA